MEVGRTGFAIIGYASCSSIMYDARAKPPLSLSLSRRISLVFFLLARASRATHLSPALSLSHAAPLLHLHRLVINKLAVHYLPAPSFVLLAQVRAALASLTLTTLLTL